MKHQSYLSNKDFKEETNKVDSTEIDPTWLNSEELDKLMAFLQTFQDGVSCSLVQQGKNLTLETITTSKTKKNSMLTWHLYYEYGIWNAH